jgi:LacI family repressor for deo operon, udp, cdd, tsx, nupC, and nupG
VTAIFCDDDLLAGAVYRACQRLGRVIPDELSVVGFNDVALTRYLAPELTSVAIPAETVGADAVRALLGDTNGAPVSSTVVPLTLRIRSSTAAPR